MRQLLTYSPVIVLLAWALLLALSVQGLGLTIVGLTILALATYFHIREERGLRGKF